jgi:hypothetical protein
VFITNIIFYPNLLASHTPELAKLIKIGQSNAARLNDIIIKQENLEKAINEQGEKISEQGAQISEILAVLKDREEMYTEIETKSKGSKGKGAGRTRKNIEEFYQVNIESFILFLYIVYISL